MHLKDQAPCNWTRFFVAAGVATVVIMTAMWANAAPSRETAWDVATGDAIILECRQALECRDIELVQEGRPGETATLCERREVCEVAK
jgi:hypothetical protein